MSLKIAGCCFPSRFNSEEVRGNPSISVNPWRIYSAVIIVMHWLNAARILIAFKDKNDDMSYLLFKVVIFTWLILNASNVSVCYYACASPRCLGAFMEDLHMTSSFWTPSYVRYVRRRVWLYSIGVWIMATCNYAFMVYVLFKNSTFEMLLVPLTKTMAGFDIGKLSSIHHNNFVNKFLANNINLILMILLSARFCYMVVMLWMTTAWIFPMAFFYMICSLISGQFQITNKMLEQSVTDEGKIKGKFLDYQFWLWKNTCVGYCSEIVGKFVVTA